LALLPDAGATGDYFIGSKELSDGESGRGTAGSWNQANLTEDEEERNRGAHDGLGWGERGVRRWGVGGDRFLHPETRDVKVVVGVAVRVVVQWVGQTEDQKRAEQKVETGNAAGKRLGAPEAPKLGIETGGWVDQHRILLRSPIQQLRHYSRSRRV
jgi:hypothetical protein